MKIKSVTLENFRSYAAKTEIPISALTALIGKNDAGKSSVLEALDIFFEGGAIKISSDDGCKSGNAQQVRIGVVFTDVPQVLVLDSDAPTTLNNEFLVNQNGDLEIYKTFNCQNASPKPQVHARALHPTAGDVKDVLQKNQKALKAIIKEKGLEANCNQTENPSMRHAIYQAHANLALAMTDVPLNDENGKAVWNSLQNYLPLFALFQSDRPSSDQDPEVQNPMKLAIEQALDQLQAQLDVIAGQVQARAQETAERTLDKLKVSYPDLASTLKPNFKKPAWKSIFKLDLEAGDGIPLNKRGSGVRRLILMSFFQAEAERRRNELAEGGGPKRPVVYAVEEPETSQHPDSQAQVIATLKEIAQAGDQVIVTTHVPALAGLIPLESLRYIEKTAGGAVRVRAGGDATYEDIARGLGVLPDPVEKPGLRVAVLMEGKNDIDALKSLASILVTSGQIPALDETKIFWTIGGGDTTLKDWIERRYLDKLGVPQVVIQDSDKSAAAVPLSADKSTWLQNMQAHAHITAFITRKRNMDNYVHPSAIARTTAGAVTLPANIDTDYVRMADTVSQALTAAKAAGTLNGFFPNDHSGLNIAGLSTGATKRIIASYFMRNMTLPELNARSQYTDGGQDKCEVREWLTAISQHL